MHSVSEHERKEDTFELFEKGKENRLMNPSREMTQFKMKIKFN